MEANVSAISLTATHTSTLLLLLFFFALDAAVDLVNHMRSAPRIPIFARLRHDVWNLHFRDFRRPLQDVHRVTHTGVPGDMAVVWPDAWIVRSDLDH